MKDLNNKIHSPMVIRLIQLEDKLWTDQSKRNIFTQDFNNLDKIYDFSIDNPLINIKISICRIHHIPYYIY